MGTSVDEEKYNLKWNSHNSIMANTVLEHLTREELVDVTLSCEGKFIRAHRLILSASSLYFKELFRIHEAHNPIIIMMNIRFEYLQYIIDYIYKGEIKLLSSEIEGILKLANDLQIKGLNGILNKKFKSMNDNKVENSIPKGEDSVTRNTHEEKINSLSSDPVVTKDTVSGNIILNENQNLDAQKNTISERKRPNNLRTKNSGKIIPPKKKKFQKQKLETDMSCSSQQQNQISQVLKTKEEVYHLSEVQERSFQEPEIIIKEESDDELNISGAKTTVNLSNKPAIKQKSAFMLFTEENRPKVSLVYPEEDFKQISLRLSMIWKILPPEQKDVYYEAASRENEKLKRSTLK